MKIIQDIFVVICLFLVTLVSVQAQPTPAQKRYSVLQLKADFARMRQQLEEVHVGLYEYADKPTLNNYFDSLKASITQPLTELEFYQKIAPVLSKIRNGHTYISMSAKTRAHAKKHAKFIPLELMWQQETAFVVKSYASQPFLPAGSQILSINGQSIPAILDKMMASFSSDGYNQTRANRMLGLHFAHFYYWLVAQPQQFKIRYRAPQQTNEQVTIVPALSREAIISHRESPKSKMLDFKILNERVGLLKVGTFAQSEMKKSFKKFLRKAFAKIKRQNLQHLIIDLRNNGGGDDGYGNLLFSYLTNQPFNYYKYVATSVNKIAHPEYYQEAKVIRKYNAVFPNQVKKVGKLYHVKKNPGLGTFSPQKNPFLGKVYILINGACFSATGEFAACVHNGKRATFIGEEVGGNYHKNTSGEILTLVLPNTGVRIFIPLMQYVMDVKNYPKGYGVKPTHSIHYTVEAMLQGKDLELAKALELINTHKPQEKK